MGKEFNFDVTKFRDTFLEWFISESLTGIDNKKMSEIVKLKSNKGDFKITMQVNGIDVDPEKAIKYLGQQYHKQVIEGARELADEIINEKINAKLFSFTDYIDECKKELHNTVADELGIKRENKDY